MLGISANRLATSLAGGKDRGLFVICRNLSAAGIVGGRETSAGRWRSFTAGGALEGQGQKRWASTEVAPKAQGITLDVDEKVHRVKHRVPQKR